MPRCVHCLNPAGNTRDHVFPGSWYPDSTPEAVQRTIAPSCRPCNERSGKLENYILGRLGLCMDPTKAEVAGIAAKALRAVGIGVEGELSAKENAIRAKLKARLMQETMPYSKVAGKPGILPGFGPRNEFSRESQIAVSVNADALKDVCRKIVRGLEHYVAGRYIEPPYILEVFFIDDEAAGKLAVVLDHRAYIWGLAFKFRERVRKTTQATYSIGSKSGTPCWFMVQLSSPSRQVCETRSSASLFPSSVNAVEISISAKAVRHMAGVEGLSTPSAGL